MRPMIETIAAALLLALAVFLWAFGAKGFLLLGAPAGSWYLPREWEQGIAAAALLAGGWFAVSLCAAYPAWRRVLLGLAGVLLAGEAVLFVIGFSGIIR